jgi:hypothetical protein
MANFTVRIELHAAGEAEYTQLRHGMMHAGFRREIYGDDGIYTLPLGEYHYCGNKSAAEVLECAKRAAQIIGKNFEALVTESAGGRLFCGLSKVS